RERIDALAPRVCATNLDTVAYSLCDNHLQSVIERVGLPKHAGHASEIRIEFLTVRCWREEITSRRERRQNHIEVIDSEGLMDATRSHITKRENDAGRKFTGSAQVPLHHIAALRNVFNIAGRSRRRIACHS